MHGTPIQLFPGEPSHRLTFFPAPAQPGETSACVLVLPGGGYHRLSMQKEGLTPALWLNTLGISAAVLEYRVAPHRHPDPLHDAQRAMRLLRKGAGDFAIDPARLGVLGFSAGGHLAASLATLGDEQSGDADDLTGTVPARPDAAALWYPVISLVPPCHQGSSDNLLGEDAPASARLGMSAQTLVNEHTPPVFIYHSANDATVPVRGVHEFAAACADHRVEHEVHVLPDAAHGTGLGFGRSPAAARTSAQRLAGWLEHLGWVRAIT